MIMVIIETFQFARLFLAIATMAGLIIAAVVLITSFHLLIYADAAIKVSTWILWVSFSQIGFVVGIVCAGSLLIVTGRYLLKPLS